MPKKKKKSCKKPTRKNNEQRELEEYTQKTKCSDLIELFTFSNLSINVSADKEVSESSISIFHDDLLERILVYLPIASIIRAGIVCKKWREITSSKRFLWNVSQTGQQKPWYISEFYTWYVYDPIIQKWQGRDFLDMMISNMYYCDSSDGLVCFVHNAEIHVCNPITKEHKKLHEPPGTSLGFSCYPAFINMSVSRHPPLFNIWVNRRSHNYIVSALYCEEVADSHGEFSFQVYDSATMKWTTSRPEIMTGWTSGCKSVICNGVLYFLIYSLGTGHGPREYGLLAHNFSSDSSSDGTLINSFIPLPCSVICGLINLKEKLIMVGAIGRPCHEELNLGFSIWLLKGKDWQEISRITHTCFYNSGLLFDSSGADDLIYIHADHDPRLVVFDMNLKQWKCCQECPEDDVVSGFCFQPRLDISP
ncbi:unnamed protein product [Rhodiola kirilowii]